MTTRSTDVPRHVIVRNALLEELRTGRLAPRGQVPTEPQLMESFGVSRTTVRRALRDLEMQGLITREPGRGTFVREPHLEPRLDRLTGFVEDMDTLGLHASASVELVRSEQASDEVAEGLRLAPHSEVIHIERVRLANGVPISFDDSWFEPQLGGRVAQENLEVEPFYAILEDKYRIALAGADFLVTATCADERIAAHLQIDRGAPVLRLRRISCAQPDRTPVLFEYLHYAGQRISYRLTLDR